jgi:hypothetical protein
VTLCHSQVSQRGGSVVDGCDALLAMPSFTALIAVCLYMYHRLTFLHVDIQANSTGLPAVSPVYPADNVQGRNRIPSCTPQTREGNVGFEEPLSILFNFEDIALLHSFSHPPQGSIYITKSLGMTRLTIQISPVHQPSRLCFDGLYVILEFGKSYFTNKVTAQREGAPGG